MTNSACNNDLPETKRKVLDAGVDLMRKRGFNATTVDDICAAAGVTKGGFFHYFKTKEDLAAAAVTRFHDLKAQEIAKAGLQRLDDPLERVFARLTLAKMSAGGAQGLTKGCLIGMFAQEMSSASPDLRRICHETFGRMAQDFAVDLAEAKARYAPRAAFSVEELARLYISVVQGSLMLAKASESNRVLGENIEQFRSYIRMLFAQPPAGKSA